jgi:hypothetical protein
LFSEKPLKYSAHPRGEDLIKSLRKVKDNYDKAHAALALRWLAPMAEEIPLIRERINQYPQVLKLYSNVKFLGV